MLSALSLLVTALLLLLGNTVSGDNRIVNISTASGFTDFSKAVNSGTNYGETTVYLDSDIDFTDELSKQFEPIGVNNTYQFKGTFDGQGHIIRNLTVSPSSKYIGIFGYPNGATIRNVVVDSSCFFTTRDNTFEEIRIGSITGRCYGCVIENIVNMADITFTSKATRHTWMGGIVGDLSLNNENTLMNCVNYGTITFAGNSERNTYLGGIIGESYGRIISNCANYGNIINSGTTSSTFIIGGVTGKGWNGTIDNCLSVGEISTTKSSNSIGGIIGDIGSSGYAAISHCYWTSNVGYTDVCGVKKSHVNITDSTVIPSLNATIMNEMNNYVENNDDKSLSKWFILDLNGGKINDIDQVVLFVTHPYFPDPVKEGYTFKRWNKTETGYIADWIEITIFVKIEFSSKDITKKDVEDIVKGYTDDNFEVEKFKTDTKSGETTIIIKFTDKKKALNFVDVIESSSDEFTKTIKTVDFVVDPINSFSSKLKPFIFLLCFIAL